MSIYYDSDPNHWFNKELSEYFKQNPITREELISENNLETISPWNKGKKGLQESWNKGKKGVQKMSVETKEKLRQINLGKKLSKEHKEKIGKSNSISRKGIEPWNKGKKLSDNYCDTCKKHYIVIHPDNSTEHVFGMKAFCQKYGLSRSAMSRISNNPEKNHKGYKVIHIKQGIPNIASCQPIVK
jgi:hypothetical protein